MSSARLVQQLWEDIDLSRRLFYVTKSKTPEGEMREIPLTRRLADLLTSMRRQEGLVFTYREESVRIIKRSWKGSLRRAGVRHLRFHDLRHTFNTRLMEAGVIQEVRMALMGHSSGQSVHSTYTHVELPIKREAIAKLEHWVKTQSNNQLEGGIYASTETSSTTPRKAIYSSRNFGSKTMAEKESRRGCPRSGEEIAPGNPGNRKRLATEAPAAPEV